jgi:hypothetical protein
LDVCTLYCRHANPGGGRDLHPPVRDVRRWVPSAVSAAAKDIAVPDNIAEQLAQNPVLSWDEAVAEIVKGG